MRYLLSKESRKILFGHLKKINNCSSLFELSKKTKISKNTLDDWRYDYKRYVPASIVPKELQNKLEILDKQVDGWGRVKGGKRTYKVILQKYGVEEIKRRQIAGGKKSKRKYELPVKINISDPLFLEFYGILLGDGWLSKLEYKGKIINLIGISGHAKLDRKFFLYCRKNIKRLLDRNAYLKERPQYNSIELNFSHKSFLSFMNQEMGFPIGKKLNLQISGKVMKLGFNRIRNIIRGVFDTDGCFYLDKTPVGKPYPCISINMKAPILIEQIYHALLSQGFKLSHKKQKDGRDKITLKGKKQLIKWVREIGSSNPKHFNKIADFLNKQAPVAQFG